MKYPILALLGLLAAGPARAADRYTVKDEGLFAPTGRHIEFADRYGWQSYEAKFEFGLDEGARRISENSSLLLTIKKNDGSKSDYKCKANDSRTMWANVNFLYGKGILVVAQCRIRPDKFADSIGIDADMVGEPTLVFSAMINAGKAEAGVQKGFYFLAGGQIAASEMNQYASQNDDPSDLAVLFTSHPLYPAHPYYIPVARFVP